MWKIGSEQRLLSQAECRFELYSVPTLISDPLVRSFWVTMVVPHSSRCMGSGWSTVPTRSPGLLSESPFLKVTGHHEESTERDNGSSQIQELARGTELTGNHEGRNVSRADRNKTRS